MPPQPYVPLVCPACGSILQLTGDLYSCLLQHRYTAPQLDAKVAGQVRQTLQRTLQQLK